VQLCKYKIETKQDKIFVTKIHSKPRLKFSRLIQYFQEYCLILYNPINCFDNVITVIQKIFDPRNFFIIETTDKRQSLNWS